MNGMELAKKLYEINREKIIQKYPELFKRMAIGLVGEGSECFGYDDEVSQDHDFEPSFCIWLMESDYYAYGEELQKFYVDLPKNIEGHHLMNRSVYGGNRRGVFQIDTFYRNKTGGVQGPETLQDWLFVPEYSLAEAVNGQVFHDGAGKFSAIRSGLLKGYPEEVRKKKIAARAALMAQSGQYNYRRCLAHGDEGATRFALNEFVKHSIHMIYLLNNCYCPYYKWMFRGMEKLEILGELKEGLKALLCAPDSEENIQVKLALIEEISGEIATELKIQKLSTVESDYLESHAFSVMETIQDETLKQLHVMAGV